MPNTTTPKGVDLQALSAYIEKYVADFDTSDLRVELIAGGRSNLTYFVTGADRTIVLRRPPLGHVLATAHDMAREYRVISALAPTTVPVARPIVLCEDDSVLGAPFYLMERVDGIVLRNFDDAVALGAALIPPLSYRLVAVLGELHAIDPESIGLSDFGRPAGFLERQLKRWSTQLESSKSREVPGIDALVDRLAKKVPTTQRSTIVHGDYRLDNVIMQQQIDGRYDVGAVVDWEMSTLGDPLTDIGLFCVYWNGMGSGSLTPQPGAIDAPPPFPPTADMVATYTETSGLDLEPLPWYYSFACFKLGVILEGIHFRHTQGQTLGDGFAGIGDLVAPLVACGIESLDEAGM